MGLGTTDLMAQRITLLDILSSLSLKPPNPPPFLPLSPLTVGPLSNSELYYRLHSIGVASVGFKAPPTTVPSYHHIAIG